VFFVRVDKDKYDGGGHELLLDIYTPRQGGH
jgi:hypothetical protein